MFYSQKRKGKYGCIAGWFFWSVQEEQVRSRGAAACVCVGFFGRQDVLVSLALVLLTLGVLLATQIERVSVVRPPLSP